MSQPTREQFLLQIEKTFELPNHTLSGNENLKTSMQFDSLAILDLATMLEKKFDLKTTIHEIMETPSLNELYYKLIATAGSDQ